MKSLFLKSVCAAAALSSVAVAGSLYDTAPAIGLPVSHAVAYSAYLSAGWDSNINLTKENDGSAFVRFGVRASYGEFESVNKVAYNASIGGALYDENAYGTSQRMFSDISLSGQFSHNMGSGAVFSARGNIAYQAEPDYANGISSSRAQGDVLMWSVNANYSQPIDTRWSWNIGAGTSGYLYSEKAYQTDDRIYFNATAGLGYKASDRTSYSTGLTYQLEQRDYGYDAHNVTLSAGVNHALDSVSSCSLTLGAQGKFIDGEFDVYPNLRAGYNRQLADDLSLNLFLSLQNENIGTYYGPMYSYCSDMTWRAGARLTYQISAQVSVFAGAELMYSDYSNGTNGMGDREEGTYALSCGSNYSITRDLTWTASYKFTQGSENAGDYVRHIVQTGLSYAF